MRSRLLFRQVGRVLRWNLLFLVTLLSYVGFLGDIVSSGGTCFTTEFAVSSDVAFLRWFLRRICLNTLKSPHTGSWSPAVSLPSLLLSVKSLIGESVQAQSRDSGLNRVVNFKG